MFTTESIGAYADYHILRKALETIAKQLKIPAGTLKKIDVLNAEKCGLVPAEVCRVWI